LFANNEALPKLAWFEYLLGDAEQSVQTLATAASHQKNESKALSLYYRGAILNRLGRFDEARATLDEALAERDDLILARQEKGESLWQLGRRDEAVSVWTTAVQRNAQLALANNELAGAALASGKHEEADVYEKQADRFTPNNPLFHWMLGRRLQDLGMTAMAEKHFQLAGQLDAGGQTPSQR
jgi:tetratricopeptide (TPR) repeat protein